MDTSANLHWLDYLVLGFVTLFTIGIGVYFALKGLTQKSTSTAYFTGNRNLGLTSTILSISVSLFSGVSMIGVPSEVYLYGGQYLLNSLAYILGPSLTAVFIVPVLYKIRLVSVNGYLEMRFNTRLFKLICSIQIIVFSVLYIAVVTYTPAVVLSVFTGWSVWSLIVISSFIAIFFTSIGGIKAVIWTDVFLFVCMFSGVWCIIFRATNGVGGVDKMWNLIKDGDRLNVFDFRPDPTIRASFWSFFIGGTFYLFCLNGFFQPAVQRYMNVKSVQKAQIAVCLSGLANSVLTSLLVISGLTIYGYYAHVGCDPIRAGHINSPNQLVAYFVKDTLTYPGVQGIFIGSILAGSLSSVSSVLNSVAANTWDDILRHFFPTISPNRALMICKALVVIYGLISTCLSVLVAQFGGTIYQLVRSLNAIFLLPIFGLFISGIFCPWINTTGVLTGCIASFGALLWITFGQYYSKIYSRTKLATIVLNCSQTDLNSTIYQAAAYGGSALNNATLEHYDSNVLSRSVFEWFYSMSYFYYTAFGISIFILVGSLVSLCTGVTKPRDIDDRFLGICYKHTRGTKESAAMLESVKN